MSVQRIRHESRQVVRELGFLTGRFEQGDASHPHCHILIELSNYESLTAQDLSNLLNLDKSTMSRHLNSLIKEGVVLTSSSRLDRRRKILTLTAKGRKKVALINEGADAQVGEALANLTQEEAEQVQRGMHLFAKALKQARLRKEFRLRPTRSQDNPALSELIATVMPEFGCSGPGFAITDPEVQAMHEAYKKPGHQYLVLEHGDRVVGGGGIAPLKGGKDRTCELQKMYFLPQARGTGMGKVLLDQLLKEAQRLGYESCYLETTTQMTQARRLYERMGFREGENMGETGHFGCDKFYVRDL